MSATSVKDVFETHIPARFQSRPDVVQKINAVYQFNISGPDGGSWSVDCTQPGGRISAGTAAAPKCTVAAIDSDFLAIVNGKLKIQGDMGLAMKLQQIL